MDLDYYKCSVCGVYADDGALRDKKFYCMKCADKPQSTIYSKEHIQSMIKSTNTAIHNLEIALFKAPKNEEYLGLMITMKQQRKYYMDLLETKK